MLLRRLSLGVLLVVAASGAVACGGGGKFAPITPAGVVITQTSPPSLIPPSLGSPTFFGPNGATGECTSGLQFIATGQGATLPIVQPGYSGTYTVADSTEATASATVTAGKLVITGLANGTTYVTLKDSAGNTVACNVGVTLTSGTVQ